VIKKKVWSGFYSEEEVQEVISDLLEEDANENLLRKMLAPEFKKEKSGGFLAKKTNICPFVTPFPLTSPAQGGGGLLRSA
jgi:hypothetical protein